MSLSASYSRWEKFDVEEEHDQWEDPMSMPVCSEIPWHQVTPLMNSMLDEQYAAEDAALGLPRPTAKPSMRRPEQDSASAPAPAAASNAPSQAPPVTRDASPSKAGGPREHALALKEAGNQALREHELVVALAAWKEAEDLALECGDQDLWAACRANAVLGALKRRDFAAAEELANGLLEKCPRHEKGLYRRGVARNALGDLPGARQDFIRAVSVNFMNTEAQDALARVQASLSKEGKASPGRPDQPHESSDDRL